MDEKQELEFNEQIGKGMMAESLLNHPLLVEFFRISEQSLLTGIKVSAPMDYEKREEYCKMLKMLDSLKTMLEHYIAGGKQAEQMMKRLKEGKFEEM